MLLLLLLANDEVETFYIHGSMHPDYINKIQ